MFVQSLYIGSIIMVRKMLDFEYTHTFIFFSIILGRVATINRVVVNYEINC